MSQPSRLEKKAQDCIDRGEFYEAHQVYRTLYFRKTQQEQYDDLLQILCNGSKKLGDVKEALSALDLAELYAETLLKSKTEPSEKIFEQLSSVGGYISLLLQLCDPSFPIPSADSLNKFISTCVKWSQTVASRRRERKHGLSELHYVIAQAFLHHRNYVNARNHMLFADHPEEFAKLLHTIREEGGSKSSEAEIFCVLPFLQMLTTVWIFHKITGWAGPIVKLLAMHRVHTASKLLTAYLAILNESPSCNGCRQELFNFLKMLCSALNLHDVRFAYSKQVPVKVIKFVQVKLFDHLVEAYKPHLDVDPTYHSYLEKIGQIFFGNPPKNKNDSFGGLFGNILKGIDLRVLGEKKEEDEIFSDSDFEAGSIHTGRSETEDAYETAEESEMTECDRQNPPPKRATEEIFDDLD
ncbi:unnamed protein product [Haemonchus placei]|uniref:Golgi to er traffic protein 4 homolog n=1 Tax=Haemonchus placei TaxID=6290 RepID=A0A0N4WNH3_HAEPC|nr:unnamed protein product [Haemonchus placei]